MVHDLETIVRGRADLLVEELSGELVILDPISADVHHLDRQAATVWRLLEESGDLRQIIGTIVDVTEADPARVAADVFALVEQLMELGLVTPGRGGS